ncbi:proton channel OtopLc isoform X2 [Cryptotermes secundus]|uniref:proton channel OtopLc isoform X2 n=1 Tax=Cryptotermes secundus TaxID=105785 RepID=UPI000CD7CA9A|nr:proton channel OtopLc isoform X2 [Cryptotermes secundus]
MEDNFSVRYQQMGYSVSSEEDLAIARAGDRKPEQHFTMSHKDDTKRVGRKKYTRFDGLRDNNDYKLKNRTEGDPCTGEGPQELDRVDVLDVRKEVLKLNPSDLRAGLEQVIHKNNNKGGRGASGGELELKRRRFNVKPSPETNQDEQIFQDSTQLSSDGQKMVLQLVLPQAGTDNIKQEPPITPKYIHYDLFKPRKGYQHTQPELFPDTQQFCCPGRGLGTSCSEIFIPDSRELTVTSLGGSSGILDQGDPPATPPKEKIEMFRGYLTVTLSCVYAVFIVTLGVVIYVSDIVLRNGTPLAESFSIYLVVLGLVYFAFLYVDIRRYLRKVKRRNTVLLSKDDISIKDSDIVCHGSSDGNHHLAIPFPSKLAEDPLPHHYCFSKGRHSGSFYLKVGAAGFCFGHLIHSGLMLGYQIVYLRAEGQEFYNCASIATLLLDVLYPVYSFLQLFFIFKYSNVIINRCKELGRFALMHCIASSLCFWIWTILRETLESLNSYANHDDYSADDDDGSEETDLFENSVALPLTANQKTGARNLIQCLNQTSWWDKGQCRPPDGLAIIASQFSPYLYPFTIEYSILVVGILFIIWQNIGKCAQDHSSISTTCPVTGADGEHSNLVIHADCHSANKGLFAGLIVLVGSIVSIILFCIAMADNEFVSMGLTVNAISELILLLLMTVAVILAYRKLTQLDVNSHPISLLDDLLLFICIPAFFLYGIFCIVPAILKNNGLSIAITLLQVIQVLLQTPFIIDGLRRCSNTRQLRFAKPGRELVTFLVVCNVAMWITETFEIKSYDRRDDRYEVYGKVLWTMLSHMTVPLTMFYRFHSSVCLVDIWKSAYERGE